MGLLMFSSAIEVTAKKAKEDVSPHEELVQRSKASKSKEQPVQQKAPARKGNLEQQFVINFHDNCPKVTLALQEEVTLRSTIEGYRGVMTAVYSVFPDEKNVYPAVAFYRCCDRIRLAMEKAHNVPYKIVFNSRRDRTGSFAEIDTEEKAAASLNRMMEEGVTDLYAFYLQDSAEE